MVGTNLFADLHNSFKVLFPLDHVHHGVLEQCGEHEHQAGGHPHVDGLDVRHLGQLASNTLKMRKAAKTNIFD
jgi:hypothetical protein